MELLGAAHRSTFRVQWSCRVAAALHPPNSAPPVAGERAAEFNLDSQQGTAAGTGVPHPRVASARFSASSCFAALRVLFGVCRADAHSLALARARPRPCLQGTAQGRRHPCATDGVGVSGSAAGPAVVMVCGTQGSGKTTTCAKLAMSFQMDKQKKVRYSSTPRVPLEYGLTSSRRSVTRVPLE